MPFTENELKIYLTEHFMNAPVQQFNHEYDEEDIPEIDYSIKNEKVDTNEDFVFKYLEKDTLSTDIEYERDYLKQYSLHLCLYSVNQESRLPFVNYYFSEENLTYIFPKKPLNMRNFLEIKEKQHIELPEDEENDEQISEVDLEFFNQVKEFYKSILNIELIEENFKGFTEKNNDIFAFIDVTNESSQITSPFKKGIIDEIINANAISGKFIDKSIINLFQTQIELQTLRTLENIEVEIPKIGYIIETTEDGEYENLFKNDDEMLLIFPVSSYEDNNDTYIFSSVPLKQENIENIHRFACFAENLDEKNEKSEEYFVFVENNVRFYGLIEEDLFAEI